MRHLEDTEIVDLMDGALAPSLAEHVDECDACRERLAALRGTLGEVGLDQAHEPSPLFWNHFAARVSEAVDREPPVAAAPAGMQWMRNPAAAWAASASIAVLLMVTALWRATLHAPVPDPVRVPTAAVATVPDNLETDRAWAVVRTATDDLAWEDVVAAGIAPRPGSVEGAVPDLTVDERAELARLIESEMKRSGLS